MRTLFPVIFSLVLIAVFGIVQLLFFKYLNREWWQRKWIRRAAWMLPSFGAIAMVMWGYGEYYRIDWIAYPGTILAVLTFIFEVGLIFSLPLSGMVHFVNWVMDKLAVGHRKPHKTSVDRHRRLFLKSSAAAIPLATLAAGAGGVVAALSGVKVYKRTIEIDNLPDSLDGLKILHLSDLHLRHYVTLGDLTRVLTDAEPYQPDITLVTGDIADDVKILPGALSLVHQLNSPLGAYASLGNHEYFRGIADVLRTFDRSSVPLLVNKAVRLEHNGTPLIVAGIDDPRMMGSKEHTFFKNCIDATLPEGTVGEFVVMMSHRPDALDYAAEKGVALTLAGHTHGGQVGMGGRSLFESYWPDRYLWGHYRIKQSHLYTSAGVGHWFPFRLGCPPEAPILELKKS